MGSDDEGSGQKGKPVQLKAKSDEDEQPIGSLFKIKKSRVSHRKKSQLSDSRAEENPSSENTIVSGEIYDTLAVIKKKLKRPKRAKDSDSTGSELREDSVLDETDNVIIDADSDTVKSKSKKPRKDSESKDEGKEETAVHESSDGSLDLGLEDSLSVLFKKSRKNKNQSSEKRPSHSLNGDAVKSVLDSVEIRVLSIEEEIETKERSKEDGDPHIGEENKTSETPHIKSEDGLNHCSDVFDHEFKAPTLTDYASLLRPCNEELNENSEKFTNVPKETTICVTNKEEETDIPFNEPSVLAESINFDRVEKHSVAVAEADTLAQLARAHSFEEPLPKSPINDSNLLDAVDDAANQSLLRSVRNVKRRRHDDMAYEGDADWEDLTNVPVDQPNQTFKTKDCAMQAREAIINGAAAAVAVGLKSRAITPIEKLKFKEVLKRKGGLQEYLDCRNMILGRWCKDVKHVLHVGDCGVSNSPSDIESPREALIREIYLFLDQNGYINAGIASERGTYEPASTVIPPHAELAKECEPVESNNSPKNLIALIPGQFKIPETTKSDLVDCKRIIVIGAGPSGLAAARHLKRQGFSVTVLEARDRIGGRVYTDRTSLSVPVDLGASIITGVEADLATERRPDPSSLICSQLGLDLTVLNSDCPLYDLVTGHKVPPDLDEALEAEYNALLDDMVLVVAQNGEDAVRLSLEDGLEYALQKRRGSRTLGPDRLVLKDNGTRMDVLNPLERRVMDWHYAHLEYGCATMLKEVSLPYWNQDDAYGGFGGAHCMIKGGFGTVVESLAKELDICLEHVVTEVQYGVHEGKAARVCASNGSEFKADAVLITIPLGCLKAGSIKFTPDLPDWKQSSISRLGFGVLNKVVLEFPSVFWDDSVDYFGATAEETDRRGQCFMFWNVKKTVGAPVLIALVVGKAAVDHQNSPANHVGHAMMVLRKIFGEDSVPDPVGSVVTDWGAEPFTRGAYSYVAVGACGEDYDIIGRPIESCLFFAGEATCKEHPDTVGGAMLSGMREAIRIIGILRAGKDYVAEVEVMEAVQRRSDGERNEVRDVSRRLEACDAIGPLVSKESVLREMFFNAKTTAGRLHLAKELLRLPVDVVKSFAGSKEGLGTLNSWILDSLGKNATQLLRHCVRLLVLVSTDLVAVRLSGIGRTVKEKVCMHTSRDIRAIASQLVRVWIEVFRKEKASNGGLKLLRHVPVAEPSKTKAKDSLPGKFSGNRKSESKVTKLETMADTRSEASSLHSQKTSQGVESEFDHNTIMSEEEAAAYAAAEAARAAAIAAAEAFASAEAELASRELPKIPSFQKFARREQYAQQADDSDPRKKLLPSSNSDIDSRNCKVAGWHADITATCPPNPEPNAGEHSGESREADIRLTRAWVDADAIGADGLKDSLAIERWQSQAMEADADFYSKLHITEQEESTEALTLTLRDAKPERQKAGSSASQVAESKPNSEGRGRGVDRIKQGVVDYVSTLLMPLYKARKLDRDGYKAIMKKTVAKVIEQCTEAEKVMHVYEFLDSKRKNKIRALVDKLIERQTQVNQTGKS